MAGNDANSGLTPELAKRTFEAARTTFNSMPGGDTVAFCRGGSWVVASAAADTIGNNACGRDASGTVIHASLDANFKTIPTGTVAPGTVCTWRDFSPSWGGTAKPRINKTGGTVFNVAASDADDGGYNFTNLDVDGSGGGQIGWFVYAWSHDIQWCANTVRNFGNIGIQVSGTAGQPAAPNSGVNWNMSILGNQFSDIKMGLYLEPGDGLDLSYNTFNRVGSGDGFNHAYYVSSIHAAPWGDNATLGSHFIPNHGAVVRGNYHSGAFGGALCKGSQGKFAGKMRDVLFENNVYNYPSAASDPAGTCWLWGMAASNDQDSAGFRNVVMRRNRFIGGGNQLVGISGCVDCSFEDNILASDWPSGDLVFLNVAYSPRLPSHGPAAVNASWNCDASKVWGFSACDDVNTRMKIVNNTFYRGGTAQWNKPIEIFTSGDGYVVANNAMWTGGASISGNCLEIDRPTAFVGNNYCRAGSGAAASAVFVNAPADFTPLPGGPLAGTGDATNASPVAIGTIDWTASDAGRSRTLPPDIGAYTR